MPGFMPGIHVFETLQFSKTWMRGTSPRMTLKFFATSKSVCANTDLI